MSVRVELWIDGALVDEADEWWDDFYLSLPDEESRAAFPLLSRVDPEQDVFFQQAEMNDLGAEARQLSTFALQGFRPFLNKLAALCDAGAGAASAQLRFVGD